VNGNGVITVAASDIDTQGVASESIVSVQSDGANGAVILYKYSNNLYVQRIDNSCTRLWGANGRVVENSADVTSQEVISYDAGSGDVLVAANVANDIKAARVGLTNPWAWKFIVQDPLAVQQNPAVFISGGNDFVVWDDARFFSNAYLIMGYGIFGVKIDPATGLVFPAWYANSWGGPDAQNGVSLVFNSFQRDWPVVKLVPYNNGTQVMMIWNDYGNPGMNAELVFIDPNVTGVPYFPGGITTPY